MWQTLSLGQSCYKRVGLLQWRNVFMLIHTRPLHGKGGDSCEKLGQDKCAAHYVHAHACTEWQALGKADGVRCGVSLNVLEAEIQDW